MMDLVVIFGNKHCLIKFNNNVVGHAFQHDKLYLLALDESISNVDASSSKNKNKRKRIDDISSKVWHCHLCYVSRGRIECLVKESILSSLEFSYFELRISCIKGKYVKKIKKNEKQSAGILEIIHIDICGSFPITYVGGYDSFITFTDGYSRYGYFYPIKE
jgi:hypothetical protein